MSSYKEIAAEAKRLKTAKEVTTKIFKFERKGDEILGRLIAVEDFTSEDYKTSAKKYTFDTDAGKISCIPGSMADSTLNLPENIGKIFWITFEGNQKGKRGKDYHSYSIYIIPETIEKGKK